MSADTPRRLGRGLEALISTARQSRQSADDTESRALPPSELQRLRIADISPNRYQPRRTFTSQELAELQGSMRENGLLQPITVRARPEGGWELVTGERRLRAAIGLGWDEIPAVVRAFDDRAMLTLALVENLQRSDLNPLEEAEGIQRLIGEFELTQQQVADAIGKDRTTVTNLLRILTLPTAVRAMVERGQLSAGHARALLPLKDEKRQLALASEIVARGLSVREAETRARSDLETPTRQKPTTNGSVDAVSASGVDRLDPALKRAEDVLRKRLQTDVQLQPTGPERGTVRIAYYSADDLERVLDLIVGRERSDFDQA